MLELICPEKFPGWYQLLIRDLMPLYATGVALIAAGLSIWSVRVRNRFEKKERKKQVARERRQRDMNAESKGIALAVELAARARDLRWFGAQIALYKDPFERFRYLSEEIFGIDAWMRSLATAEATVERGWKAIAEVHSVQRVRLANALRLTQTGIENTRSLAADLQLRASASKHYGGHDQHDHSVVEFFEISSVIAGDIADGVVRIRAELSHVFGVTEREAEAEQDNINETDLVALAEKKSLPSQRSTAYIYALMPLSDGKWSVAFPDLRIELSPLETLQQAVESAIDAASAHAQLTSMRGEILATPRTYDEVRSDAAWARENGIDWSSAIVGIARITQVLKFAQSLEVTAERAA